MSPKRLVFFSNSCLIQGFDIGRLTTQKRLECTKVRTTRTLPGKLSIEIGTQYKSKNFNLHFAVPFRSLIDYLDYTSFHGLNYLVPPRNGLNPSLSHSGTYIDKKGKKRFAGNGDDLSNTKLGAYWISL